MQTLAEVDARAERIDIKISSIGWGTFTSVPNMVNGGATANAKIVINTYLCDRKYVYFHSIFVYKWLTSWEWAQRVPIFEPHFGESASAKIDATPGSKQKENQTKYVGCA